MWESVGRLSGRRRAVTAAICAAGLLAASGAWGRSSTPAPAGLTNRDLVEMVEISGVSLSPDGRYVAFRREQPDIARNGLVQEWFVASVDGTAPPRRIADGGGPIWNGAGVQDPEMPVWSPDSQWLYYRSLADQQVQIWRVRSSGGSAEQVSRDAADVTRFRLVEHGTRLLYEVEGADREAVAAAERAEYDSGILIDRTVDIGQNLYRSVEINGRMATERLSGTWFSRRPLLGNRSNRLRIIELAPGAGFSTSPTEPDAGESIDPAARLAANAAARSAVQRESGPEIAFLIGNGAETELYWTPTSHSPTSTRCSLDRCRNVVAARWRASRREIIFTTRDRSGAQILFVWDIDRNVARRVHRAVGSLDGGVGSFSSCSVGEMVAACIAAAGSSPPRLVVVSLETGRSRVLFDPNRGLASRIQIAAEPISWPIGDGRRAFGQLLLPQSSRPVPLFISYYTCPGFLKGALGDEWPLHTMAAAGIAVLCINKVPEPRSVTNQAQDYETGLKAVRSAVRLLSARGTVDPRRVGMGGLSFGSEVTMWVTMYSDILAAVSLASPQIDPIYYDINGIPGRDVRERIARNWGLTGPPSTENEAWRQRSPALNIDRISVPLLMQLPEQEYLLAVPLYVGLLNAGKAAEMYAFPDERHLKAQPRHRLAVYDRNLDWFRFWLQDFEDPDPAKAEQYARWRRLREGQCRNPTSLPDYCQVVGTRPLLAH